MLGFFCFIFTMSQSRKLQLSLELIWWVFTAIIALATLYPIISKLPEYPFLRINIIFIIAFITFTRYIFLLKHTFLAYQQRLKIVLALLCIPTMFLLVEQITNFQTFLDEQGIDALVGHLPFAKREGMVSYVRNQILLFGVGSCISAFFLFFRLIISVWRVRNRGTV